MARHGLDSPEVTGPITGSGAEDWSSPSERRWIGVLILLAGVAFVAALAIHAKVAPSGSGNADEGVYVAEADLFRSGHVTMATEEYEPFYRPWLTGERAGRIFYQYEPAWPALLAISQITTGSTAAAPAACFALLVVVAYRLAIELFRSHASALGAAVCTLLTPLLLFQSSLTLSYLFTAVLSLASLWCAARVARRDARWTWAVGLGALLGALLLTRPVDGVLAGACCGLMLAVLGHQRWRAFPKVVGLAAIGLIPFVVVAAWFNLRTTGSITSFPLSASDPLNRFGFGERRMQIGTESMYYDGSVATGALAENLSGGISWLFGGVLGLALVVVALVRRTDVVTRLVLVAYAALFPLTYFFWWASALAGPGARNGIGPHYYVPAIAALAVLQGDGLARVAGWGQKVWMARAPEPATSRRRTTMAITALLVMVLALATWPSLPDKLELQGYVNDLYARVQDAVPADVGPAVIILRNDPPQQFLMTPFPFQRNQPGLDGDVVWALDRGGENGPLLVDRSDRQAYSLRMEKGPDDEILHPRWHLTQLSVRQGAPLALSIRVTPPANAADGTVAVTAGGTSIELPAPPAGGSSEVPLTLAGCAGGGASAGPPVQLEVPAAASELEVTLQAANGERWEQRIELWRDGGTEVVTAVLPGVGTHRVDFGNGQPVSLAEDVAPIIEVR